MTGAVSRYLRSFTGFGRDARLFLLTTIVFGAALSLYWIDFNLYLESIGLGRATIGWLMAASQLAGVVVALPRQRPLRRIGRRTVMAARMALVAVALFAFLPGQRAAAIPRRGSAGRRVAGRQRGPDPLHRRAHAARSAQRILRDLVGDRAS